MLSKWFFEFMYRFSRPPWDTGISPPELVALVDSGAVQGRRALDLGCGTGTNAIYLARNGFSVVGVDFSSKAIAKARKKARQAGAEIEWHVADVTRLDFLLEPFDLVLDVGCFHGLNAEQRARYVNNLTRLTHPGSQYLLYAFSPKTDGKSPMLSLRNPGLTSEQVRQEFAKDFELRRIEHGTNRGSRPSAWFWFVRRMSTEGGRQQTAT